MLSTLDETSMDANGLFLRTNDPVALTRKCNGIPIVYIALEWVLGLIVKLTLSVLPNPNSWVLQRSL